MNQDKFAAFEADILALDHQKNTAGGNDGYETCTYTPTGGTVTFEVPILSDIFGGIPLYDLTDEEETPDWVSTC